jgi:hypothetical protein
VVTEHTAKYHVAQLLNKPAFVAQARPAEIQELIA